MAKVLDVHHAFITCLAGTFGCGGGVHLSWFQCSELFLQYVCATCVEVAECAAFDPFSKKEGCRHSARMR
jgi:hypothetical protein